MESGSRDKSLVRLETDRPLWDRFFTVAPLVIVGTKEDDDTYDLAPKHLAMPMGWSNRFGFVCTPRHGTYQNVKRQGYFTVTYPRPSQVVFTSLAASPRCDDQSKPIVRALPTFASERIEGRYVEDGYLFLGCRLDRIIDEFDENSLITGFVEEAMVHPDFLRVSEQDDADMVRNAPLLAYLAYGYYSEITEAQAFPMPEGFTV